MIEGAESHDHTDRFSVRDGKVLARGRIQVHRNLAAAVGAHGLDADANAVDSARNFDARIQERLAAFAGRFNGKMLRATFHDVHCLFERRKSHNYRSWSFRIFVVCTSPKWIYSGQER